MAIKSLINLKINPNLMKIKNIIKLIIAIAVSFSAGIIGSIFTSSSIPTWYAAINKPSFNPPNWIFAPVWNALFLLMGISLYLVWINKSKLKKKAITLFGIQLGLNALWSIIFFGLHSPLAAFIEIIILWIAILLTIIYFYRISKTASYLLMPYIIWVSFAAVLNFFIFLIN